MNMIIQEIRRDVEANKGNFRMLLFIMLFRAANLCSRLRKRSILTWPVTIPALVLYRFFSEWLFQIELPAATTVGAGLIIDHGYSLVVNKNTVIGENCRLRHNVTIGCKIDGAGRQLRSPVIGNNVDIGAGAIIIGAISIGDNVRIGAGSVVIHDVPSNAVAVGNPARNVRGLV